MRDPVHVTPAGLLALRQAGERLRLPHNRRHAQQAGVYLSRYKGRGMEFEESRRYQAGDDIRSMDWRVTARTGHPHTKIYREERERPVLFCVDFRRSMFFATRGAFKAVVAAEAAALLAWASNQHGDRVGGLAFSDAEHYELRPQRGKNGVLKLIRFLSDAAARRADLLPQGAPMAAAMARLRRVTRPGSLVMIGSDFRALDQQAEAHLAQLARHNSVILLLIFDPLEIDLPPAGLYKLRDLDREALVDSAPDEARRRYAARFTRHRDHLQSLCRRYGMTMLSCPTHADVPAALQAELTGREAA